MPNFTDEELEDLVYHQDNETEWSPTVYYIEKPNFCILNLIMLNLSSFLTRI
jgi:hypothetical protein